MSGIVIISPTMSSMAERRVTAIRSRTNAMRIGGVRLRLYRIPHRMRPAARCGGMSEIGPMCLTPRNTWPVAGGADISVRLANSSGRSTRASSATRPAKL